MTQHSHSRTARRNPRRALHVATLVGLLSAFVNHAAPVGIGIVDATYRGVFTYLIVRAAWVAPRWTWIVAAVIATVTTASTAGQLVGAAAVFAATHGHTSRDRARTVGAIVAGISTCLLLAQGAAPLYRVSGGRIDDAFGSSAVLTAVALAPIVFAGLRTTLWPNLRRWMARAVLVGSAAAVAMVVSTIALLSAVPDLRAAYQRSVAVADAASDANPERTIDDLDELSAQWDRVHARVSRPWMIPGRLLPVIGQNIRATQAMSGQAAELTAQATDTLRKAERIEPVRDGSIDVDRLAALVPTLHAMAESIEAADRRLAEADSGWLLPPLDQKLDAANRMLPGVAGRTRQGVGVVDAASELLDRGEPATILVLVATPAEARGVGGFVGQWAELTATDGSLELTNQYRSGELNRLLEAKAAVLRAPDDYRRRYGRLSIERHIQDVTVSPDFPTVARVASDLYDHATGTSVDAVLMLDPFVLDELLQFTGPLETASGLELRRGNTADQLLTAQYEQFDGDNEVRVAALDDVAGLVLDALIDDPPDPYAFVRSMAPMAEQGRLALWIADSHRASEAPELALTGGFPRVGVVSDDVFGIVHQNAGQNKIDSLLQRRLVMVTDVDVRTGRIRHSGRLELTNGAPSSGLSDAVIGSNDQGLAPGTNRMTLSVYTPHRMTEARVADRSQPVETQSEFGMFVHSIVLSIGPGESTRFDFELEGTLPLDGTYTITVAAQPLANPDLVEWRIGDVAFLDEALDHDLRLDVDDPPGRSQRD